MKVRAIALSAILTVSILATCTPLFAHHGNAAYDEKNPLTIKGTVTKFMWANPHTLIYFDAKDSKGNVQHWSVETLSPGKLARAGWTQVSVKPGDQVTLTFSPAKDGSTKGFLQKIQFEDGKQLGMLEHPQ